MKKQGLGRGLSVLISDAADEQPQQPASINEIDIEAIEANPWQPRNDFDQELLEELAASIRSVGIVQPLTLRHIDDQRFQIIAGERRFRAAKIAGLQTVPAYIRDAEDDAMLELALIENLQRSDLNPIEEALSYQRLIDECHYTQEAMADRVGKKRSTVTNYLRLLRLPAEIQAGLRERKITMGHARAIIGIDDEATQTMLYEQTLEYGYSVRQIEDLVREYNNKDDNPSDDNANEPEQNHGKRQRKQLPEEYRALKDQLDNYFGTQVKFERQDDGKGKITIPFASDEELERIMGILDKAK